MTRGRREPELLATSAAIIHLDNVRQQLIDTADPDIQSRHRAVINAGRSLAPVRKSHE
jgi:hypothetical protein